MVVHYPRAVWNNNYAKHEVTDTLYNLKNQNVLLSNVIDADHQNSCLFTNKGHFSSPIWILGGVLA